MPDNYSKENEFMAMIDEVESFHMQKMNLIRNTKYIEIADVQYLCDNLWGEKPEDINYRYIWACWIEEQEEVNSNGW